MFLNLDLGFFQFGIGDWGFGIFIRKASYFRPLPCALSLTPCALRLTLIPYTFYPIPFIFQYPVSSIEYPVTSDHGDRLKEKENDRF
jgi:hypothetical protein